MPVAFLTGGKGRPTAATRASPRTNSSPASSTSTTRTRRSSKRDAPTTRASASPSSSPPSSSSAPSSPTRQTCPGPPSPTWANSSGSGSRSRCSRATWTAPPPPGARLGDPSRSRIPGLRRRPLALQAAPPPPLKGLALRRAPGRPLRLGDDLAPGAPGPLAGTYRPRKARRRRARPGQRQALPGALGPSDAEQQANLEALLLTEAGVRHTKLERLRRAPARAIGVGLLELSGVPSGRVAALARVASSVKAQTIARMPEERGRPPCWPSRGGWRRTPRTTPWTSSKPCSRARFGLEGLRPQRTPPQPQGSRRVGHRDARRVRTAARS